MKYKKIYDDIIERAKQRVLQGYTEKHHIIPKCLSGNNSKTNKVSLTAREHFICHQLLTRIYPDNNKLKFALWAMCNQLNTENSRVLRDYKVTSVVYEKLKIQHSKMVSQNNSIRTISDETRRKISQSNKGKVHSAESRLKMVLSRTGQKKGPYKLKDKKFKHICENCKNEFMSADIKGRFCVECKKPRACLCGCNKMVKTPGHYYCPNHSKIGKSYLEIYGTSTPSCGFKKKI